MKEETEGTKDPAKAGEGKTSGSLSAYKALLDEGKRLAEWVPPPPDLDDAAYADFVEKFHKEYQIDLKQYKEKQMRRRINMMLTMYGLKDYDLLLAELRDNPKAKTKFFDRLTINVSEFYRNPERWDNLRDDVLGPMMAKQSEAKFFCAGCSTGEEPYTLSTMALKEKWSRVSILGWDIDQDALNQAQRGSYMDRQVKHVPPDVLAKYFTQQGDTFSVNPDVKRLVKFEKHNLLESPFPGPFDLILCRNVVIYFTEETKDRLYERFVAALKPGGFLFVGSTERVVNAAHLGLEYFGPFIYRKK